MQSDYMHWAKFKQPVRYNLCGSEVPHFRMDSLPITLADLDLDGASHPRYAPLREAIASRYGVRVEQVVAADGTSMANFLAMAAIIAPGDEVLIEHPAYEPLLAAASFLGAKITRFERSASDDFQLRPAAVAQRISDRTRLIVITNLHNPTSALATEAQLRAVGEIAGEVGARVLVDEVYLDSAFSPQATAARLGPEFVCTNSLTKVYGLSGLRCGWIIADPELAERMWRLNDLFGVNQAHAAERLSCIAFEHIDEVIGTSRELLASNRQRWNEFAASCPQVECMPASHGTTAFPRWTGGDSERLDALLRERYDLAVVPGEWFEMRDHFRVGFGIPTSDFEEALRRLGQALDELA
jgi:aspartate/methionine/tyrosine aminotransferase